jgi:signal transduction histidine kinase
VAETEPQTGLILIVDDEPGNVEALGEILQHSGFLTAGAADGPEALQQVAQAQPDLVLLDVRMPGLDGFEVCRRLKGDRATAFLPVVIITGLNSAKDRIRGVEAGADDFLTKPINPLEMVTRVRSLVRVKRLHDEVEAHRRELERRVEERTSQLRQALEELRELDRLKSEFVGRVSHELRTPLQHVKGFLALLAEGALDSQAEDFFHGLNSAMQSAHQLDRLVQDVVDLDRSHYGPLDLRPTSVATSLREAVGMVEQAHASRRVNIVADLPEPLPAVLADATALTRCLRHLLDNAVKFGPEGSVVRVRAEVIPWASRLRLSVHDDGPGIPAAELARVLRGFHQIDGSSTRRHRGAGVGLALVKMLLEAQGSKLVIEPAQGQGGTVGFELPLAPAG